MKNLKFALLTVISVTVPLTIPTMALAAKKDPAKSTPAPGAQQSVTQEVTPDQTTKEPNIVGVWEQFPEDPPYIFVELEQPPGGGPKLREPFASQWKARRDERAAKLKAGTPLVDPSTLCLPEGMPTVMGANYPLQIVQTPGQVTVLGEYLSQTRRIILNGKMPPAGEVPPSYYGYSVGRWEGDTLVVETLGVREDTQFFEIPHSSEMKITERIRLAQPGYLEDQITIEDPKFLLEPYKFTYGYKRNDDYEITEYICEREDLLLQIKPDGTVHVKD